MARILIIEDDREIRSAIRVSLERAGHAVEEAADGQEGVERYARAPCDLVISDINMPQKDGIESLLELRADFPDLKLIAISGERDAFLDTAREFGAVRTLAKPFAAAELVRVVEEVLGQG